MKKILILLIALFIAASSTYAADYSPEFKKSFYDGFLGGMFKSYELQLIKSGYAPAKVKKHSTALKSRVNRKQLEAQTWGCVSKYTVQQLATSQQKISNECFAPWVKTFFTKNADLQKLLL